MDDYAPPSGPPPPPAPRCPPGWTARWNDQYKQWFFVNIYTKTSQWEKPTAPVYPPGEGGAPADPPPGYEPSDSSNAATGDVKKNPYADERPPFNSAGTTSSDPDAALAAKLQAEEESRARGGPGGHDPSYSGPGGPFPGGQSPYPQQQAPYGQAPGGGHEQYPQDLPPRDRGKSSGGGLFGKILGKAQAKVGGGSHGASQGQYGGQQHYGGHPQQQYYPQQQQYMGGPGGPGGYPGGYGGPQYNQGGYGRGMYGGGGGGMYGQPQQRRGGGMGGAGMLAGGAAMGLGAGMLGGAMMGSAMNNGDEQDAYQDGYQDGADDGGGDDGGGE